MEVGKKRGGLEFLVWEIGDGDADGDGDGDGKGVQQ